ERMGPPAPGVEHFSLDLLKAIEYGVAHAREYQDRMEDLYLAALEVTLQRHLFEPRVFATTELGYAGSQGGRNRTPVGQDRRYTSALRAVNALGISQQLPYGGELVAEQVVTLVDSLS